jgi:sulfhydrogenase subunit delta
MGKAKPKLAVWKFSSCDGCQLSLLDCEDELLTVADSVEIAYFLEASRAEIAGPYDISLVEGSITTPHEATRIRQVRAQSRVLISIGACATAGGIQGLKNLRQLPDLINRVYAHPDFIDSLTTSTPIQDHVPVDFELRGCPINKYQLLEVLNAHLNRRRANLPSHSQCVECKLNGSVCVMVAQGQPCLGPVTQAGCGNICPACERGCFGCFGPQEAPNTRALSRRLLQLGMDQRALRDYYRLYTANATAFRHESQAHE